MNKITAPVIKVIGILLTVMLLFSISVNNVFSAGNLAPKPTKTPTPTRTKTPTTTPTRTFTPIGTPTNTLTNTPITYTSTITQTATATSTPLPAMQLIALTPHADAGFHTSYVMFNSPGIGVSTNDIYVSLKVSGITAGNGEFKPATFYPAIKNNTNNLLTFYWTALYEETGIPEVVLTGFGIEFWAFRSETGTGHVAANGTWVYEMGIKQKVLSSCHNCPYTLNTTIHFSVAPIEL